MFDLLPPSAIVRFHRLFPGSRPPQRADRSAAGTLPIRAARYCEAVTSASAFGWWVFMPVELSFFWDGTSIYWCCDAFPEWLPLDDAAQFPHFATAFDATAPASAQGCSPPFLTRLVEPGMVQIWTGLIARTAPGWSLNVRPPVNLPPAPGYSLFEGLLEADLWFGPLFANLRLTRTHAPVRLTTDLPLIQVQPVPRLAYGEDVLAAWDLCDGLSAGDWDDYERDIVRPNDDPARKPGRYAVAVRQRRQCPVGRVAQS